MIANLLLKFLLICLIVFVLGCQRVGKNAHSRQSLFERANKIVHPYKMEQGIGGTVRWYNHSKGFGFITFEEEDEFKDRSIFVHHSDIRGGINKTLGKGDIVEFQLGFGQKGPQATNVILIKSNKEILEETPYAKNKALIREDAEKIDCDFENDIVCQIKVIVAQQSGVNFREVNTETHFVKDLTVDSLDAVELIMAFEEQFNISIPDEDAEKLETVGKVIDYIVKKI